MKYWKINAIEVKPVQGELTDVVYIIHWSRIGEEVVNDVNYLESAIGTYSCPEPGEGFTPYEDLTEEQVCSWLDAGLDVVALDYSIDRSIEQKVNPAVVQRPLPWVTPPPTI